MSHSITVIGGGVVGLSLAWELLQKGFKTTVVQRDAANKTTSWSAAGILPPAKLDHALDPLDRLRGLSHQLYPDWIARLESVTRQDAGFRKTGGWYLANTRGEMASLIGMTSYWEELGVQCHQVSMDELRTREPALESWTRTNPNGNAYWLPNEWQIRPPRLLATLRQACESLGAHFVDGAEVSEVESNSRTNRFRIDQQWHECENLVLCAGAWSGQMAESLGLRQSLIPVRGQMLLLKTQSSELNAIINIGHRYLVPRDDGHVLVGSCEEETGFSPGTTTEMIRALREFAISVAPSLGNATHAGEWFGIRPMTFDGFPMIGRVPERDRLFVAAGHFRSGWHLAPATAKCLAAVIDGESPPVSLDAFGIGKKQDKQSSITT